MKHCITCILYGTETQESNFIKRDYEHNEYSMN